MHDDLGRVIGRWYPDDEFYRFLYDGTRLVGIENDPNVIGNQSGTFTMFIDADYDARGRMTRLEVADTASNVDPNSTPAVILTRGYSPSTERLEHMVADGRGGTSPNLDLSVRFDGLGRLEEMSGKYGTEELGTRTFNYDGLGRLKDATGPWEQPQSDPNDVTWTYSYDALGNLREQTSWPGTYERSWSYADGTRPRFLTSFDDGTGPDTMTPDLAGNPTTIETNDLVWSAQNRLLEVKNGATVVQRNVFDAFDDRVLMDLADTDVIFVGDDFEYDVGLGQGTKYFFLNGERIAGRAKAFTPQSASVPPWVYRWIVRPFGPWVPTVVLALTLVGFLGVLSLLLLRDPPAWAAAPGIGALAVALLLWPFTARGVIGQGGDPEWHGSHSKPLVIYGNDHLGSTRVVMDTFGATIETRDYSPFGMTVNHWTLPAPDDYDLKHQFTGQAHDDASDLHHYGARMYKPSWGRFLSPDELVDGPSGQGINRYQYVRNRPTSLIDPTGQSPLGPAFTMIVGSTGGDANPGGRASPSGGGGVSIPWVGYGEFDSNEVFHGPTLTFHFGVPFGFFQGLGLSLDQIMSLGWLGSLGRFGDLRLDFPNDFRIFVLAWTFASTRGLLDDVTKVTLRTNLPGGVSGRADPLTGEIFLDPSRFRAEDLFHEALHVSDGPFWGRAVQIDDYFGAPLGLHSDVESRADALGEEFVEFMRSMNAQ